MYALNTVYDFGMNNGDDVEYYLKKGLRVVGVEANPALADYCRARFRKQVAEETLVILNVALTSAPSSDLVPFYVHKHNHVLSQILRPSEDALSDFEEIHVAQRRASDIVNTYGQPYYIKIDIEHHDQVVLADLFDSNIRPPHISAESHSIEVFCRMVAAGYTSFNLIDGPSVSRLYERAVISTVTGPMVHSFNPHCAGPFAEDIASPWFDPDSFFRYLAAVGLGWKDIHATTVDVPRVVYRSPEPLLSFRQHVYDLLPSFRRSVVERFKAFGGVR